MLSSHPHHPPPCIFCSANSSLGAEEEVSQNVPTAHKMKFYLKDFFIKCDQIH